MSKNTLEAITSQMHTPTAVLSLLSWLAQVEGQTFSWYTSKKGRTWLTFKHNGTPTYSTSAEYPDDLSDEQTLDTIVMLVSHHLPKVLDIAPPVTTWHSGTPTSAELMQVYGTLRELLPELTARVLVLRREAPLSLKALLDAEGLTLPDTGELT